MRRFVFTAMLVGLGSVAAADEVPLSKTETLVFTKSADFRFEVAREPDDHFKPSMMVVWGFFAQNRFNTVAAFGRGDPRRIKGVWTFLFTPLHFNYRVNVLNQAALGRIQS